MMNRRMFLYGAGLVGLTPAIMELLPVLARAEARNPLSGAPVSTTSDGITDFDAIVFKIDGWDSFDPSPNEVSISVNQSWRSAWR